MARNFLGFEKQNSGKTKVIIIPVPYQGTVTFLKGTVRGPEAILSASESLEEFDHESQKHIREDHVFTLPLPTSKFRSPEDAIRYTERKIRGVVDHGQFPIVLGGEHSLTVGAVRALREKGISFNVLYFDAHLDLRDTWNGTKYNHACAARRILDLGIPVTWVGIRSVAPEEVTFLEKGHTKSVWYGVDLPVTEILETLGEHVYLSVDFDVFDSSIMPSVGNPQPGGLGWYAVTNLIEKVAEHRTLIGADFMEFSPIRGLVAPDVLAAKLVFRVVSLVV